MLICILTKNVITSCSVTMMLFLHLEVKPLMTLTTVLYLSCALISGHLAMMLMELRLRRQNVGYSNFSQPQSHLSFCVLLQYLVERRRVVTQLGKLDDRKSVV